MQEGLHRDVMLAAIAEERAGHRALLEGDHATATAAYRRAVEAYGTSWRLAPPKSYGRLVGLVKAAVLVAGPASPVAVEAAQAVLDALAGDADAAGSPVASYAAAVAALLTGADDAAARHADVMAGGSEAAQRAGHALHALAVRDGAGYRDAVTAIVRDFEGRDEHLTGVPIADTALLLEALAVPRDLAAGPRSPLFPALA